MKNNFTNFNGLYLQNYDYLSPDFFFSELIETRSCLFDWKVKTHVHTKLYQFFFIIKGEGVCLLPNQNIKFADSSILIIPPGFLHGYNWQPKAVGHILTVSSKFVEQLLKNTPSVLLKFSKPCIITCVEKISEFENCINLIDNINLELTSRNIERFQMLKFEFGQLLLNIFRILPKEDSFDLPESHTNLSIFNNFQKNIRNHNFNQKSVNEYAAELNISNIRLNKICKSIVDKSALWVINEYLISEIKLQLIHTELPISDICYNLKFNDPAYFTRFFKKHTGLSPKEYRNLINTKTP